MFTTQLGLVLTFRMSGAMLLYPTNIPSFHWKEHHYLFIFLYKAWRADIAFCEGSVCSRVSCV